MKYIVEIRCKNAAFGDTQTDAAVEVSRLLRQIADNVESGRHFIPISDVNGNRVGSANFVIDYED